MNTKITYGLIIAFIGSAIKLVNFLLGFESYRIGTPAATIYGWVVGLATLVILFMVIWFGLRAVRDEKPDQSLTYGQGVGAVVIIVLIAAVAGSVYTFIHHSFINPDFAENAMAFTRQKLAETGIGQEQIEMAEKISRITMHPGVMAVTGFFGNMFFGTIASLIAAAIVKRAPQPAAQMPPPL
jgi:hypothetical protein